MFFSPSFSIIHTDCFTLPILKKKKVLYFHPPSIFHEHIPFFSTVDNLVFRFLTYPLTYRQVTHKI